MAAGIEHKLNSTMTRLQISVSATRNSSGELTSVGVCEKGQAIQ